jgi:AcrR family transcriptional regulator
MKQIRPSANETRQKILLAAKKCFLKNGFNSTYIKDIAQKANVNTNLIFHHFMNKETLWLKVKESILEHNTDNYNYDISSAESFFKSLIDFRFMLYKNNPDLARLIQWQQMAEEESSLAWSNTASPTQLLDIIHTFQKNGEIINNISAEQIVLFIIFSSYAPFLQKIISLNKTQIEVYKEMIFDMCCKRFIS